ncbi:MAG: hypothetical protein EOM37_04055 [Proteobacteria bacterium]|jgi:hypothetical protein|nr:hypothetical protein [Alphaproteobacteria bacterium]NCC03207.1 hypothetical protein [Pseudomonadota bacterium]
MRLGKKLLSTALLTVCFVTLAQASVLLPEDNDTTPSGNLGLTPSTSSKKIQTITPPATNHQELAPTTAEEAMDVRQIDPARLNEKLGGLPENIDEIFPEEVKKYLPSDYKQAFKEALKDHSIQDRIQAQRPASFAINTTPFPIKPTGRVKKEEELTKNEKIERRMRFDYNRNPQTPTEAYAAQMYAKEMAAGEKEPLFLNEYAFKNPTEADLTDQITVQVTPDYIWGERELRMIENSLGYTPEQVAKYCQVRMDTTVKGSGTGSTFRGRVMAGDRGSFKYNSPLTTVELKSRAVCYPPESYPKKGGVITRTGDKVSVILGGQMTCVPQQEQRATRILTVKYLGEGKMQCAFK